MVLKKVMVPVVAIVAVIVTVRVVIVIVKFKTILMAINDGNECGVRSGVLGFSCWYSRMPKPSNFTPRNNNTHLGHFGNSASGCQL